MKDADGRLKSDRDQLDKQMESAARLQTIVGDKEAEVSGLKKELEGAKVTLCL